MTWLDPTLTDEEALGIVREAAHGGGTWQDLPLEFTIRALAVLVLKLAEQAKDA